VAVLRLVKDCVREVDEAVASLVETFQSSVIGTIENSFMDDISRQVGNVFPQLATTTLLIPLCFA
jgi:hypothetical protein